MDAEPSPQLVFPPSHPNPIMSSPSDCPADAASSHTTVVPCCDTMSTTPGVASAVNPVMASTTIDVVPTADPVDAAVPTPSGVPARATDAGDITEDTSGGEATAAVTMDVVDAAATAVVDAPSVVVDTRYAVGLVAEKLFLVSNM
jgi:hypothetical protein